MCLYSGGRVAGEVTLVSIDIYAQLVAADGTFDNDFVEDFLGRLSDLFEAAPEGRALDADGGLVGWSFVLMRCAVSACQVGPATMREREFYETVFELFPYGVRAERRDAPGIVRELSAFLDYLHREYGLDNARACKAVLDDNAVEDLGERLADVTRYSPAKYLAMYGPNPDHNLAMSWLWRRHDDDESRTVARRRLATQMKHQDKQENKAATRRKLRREHHKRRRKRRRKRK